MQIDQIKQIIEALLLSSQEPLSIETMLSVFAEWEGLTSAHIQTALDQLDKDSISRGIELKWVAGGYCFQSKQQFSPWIARLFHEKPARYSNALFEILAIIAYKQPVTRAEIEHIRGVTVSASILKTLLDREWIQVAGFREVPGKPAVYTTTKAFLDYFNLGSLNDLPILDAVDHE